MIKFFNAFTKITAWPVQKLCFRTKIYYENKKVQSRKIKGPAIIISNHTSVFDYAVFLFVFFSRTLRYQMAEILFRKKLLKWFLKNMGGIFVDRNSHDFSFIDKSKKILDKGGVVGVFPEGRIPEKSEQKPLEFKTGVTQLAIMSNVPIIPIYTNGSYFNKKRARVMIGTPINVLEWVDETKDFKTNLEEISLKLRKKIICLGEELSKAVANGKKGKSKKA